jgi:hypothetical protein
MIRRASRFVCLIALIVASMGCGDGEDCATVPCRLHNDKSTRNYEKCCSLNEQELPVCAFVTGDGKRYPCEDNICKSAEEPVLTWCSQ